MPRVSTQHRGVPRSGPCGRDRGSLNFLCFFQNKKNRKAVSETNLKKYGHTNFLASEIGKSQIKKTMLERYGVEWANQHLIKDSIDKLKNKKWLTHERHQLKKPLIQIGCDLGVLGDTVSKYAKIHNIEVKYFYQSSGERELAEWLQSLNIKVITNTRTIIKGELDIFLPDYNLAIEYNGLYWHCELGGKDINYHLNKTNQCEENNIRLLMIFEDEWKFQKQKCKDTILHLLGKSERGVYARNTTIKEISWKTAKEFLDQYHLLGSGSSGSYRIGAFDKQNNLIAVMVFGNKNNEWSGNLTVELKRFVTNKKNNPGLGSKMFKYAVKEKRYNQVIAFVDRRWFTGLVKEFIGFKIVSYTKPSIWWTNGKERLHRRFISKSKLQTLLNVENKTKKEMLAMLRYHIIWDCGKIKLEWNEKLERGVRIRP